MNKIHWREEDITKYTSILMKSSLKLSYNLQTMSLIDDKYILPTRNLLSPCITTLHYICAVKEKDKVVPCQLNLGSASFPH